MSETLQMCCRVCLELAGEQVCALTSATLRLHLETCLDITVSDSDELPTNVCVACVDRLNDFHAFRASARNSQDWLEATVRAARRNKTAVQPIADSEYNSDSLLEFLNNTENIEEYLNGLGEVDAALPSLVGLLDRQPDTSREFAGKLVSGGVKVTKITSTKAASEEARRGRDDTYEIHMEIDVLDSDADVAEEVGGGVAASSTASAELADDHEAYSCLACKAVFTELAALGLHMSMCESAARTCFECGLQFDSKRKMLKHRVSHAPADDSQAVCDACGKKFANQVRQLQHYEKCHNDFVASMGCIYRCKECGELFRDRFQLYCHAKEHVARSEPQPCDVCERSFADLAEHKRTEHGGPNVLYRCKVCRVVCADRRQLYAHVKQHTSALAPQRHLCHACGKSYTSLAALNRHVVTHVGDKYKCAHCQKECTDGDALRKHMRTHERESAVCEFCGLTFLKHQFLQKHLKEVHS